MGELKKSTVHTLSDGGRVEISKNGLVIPDDVTDEGVAEVGKMLGQMEGGRGWLLGDFINTLERRSGRWGTEESIKAQCQNDGLNYNSSLRAASVAGRFNNTRRRVLLSFSHYQEVTNGSLTDEQVETLLDWAESTPRNKKAGPPVSQKMLREKVKETLGVEPEPVVTVEVMTGYDNVDKLLQEIIEAVPKAAGAKITSKMKKAVRLFQKEYEKQVRENAEALVKARVGPLKERLDREMQKAREEKELHQTLTQRIDGVISQAEFQMIRGCLHPDRAPNGQGDQFQKAFVAFNKLNKLVPKGKWQQ